MKDIALDSDGDIIVPLRLVEGAECLAQRLRIRFKFFKGDWFLNPEEGVPYLEEILGQKIESFKADRIFRMIVESTPGVDSIISFSSTLDPRTRALSVEFSVKYGDEVVTLDEDFIL